MDAQQSIIEWLLKLKGWQTELAYRILTKKIENEDIQDIIELLKSGSVFIPKEFPQIINFETKNQIKIISIESIQNIENLAPRNALKFEKDKNLIVIYGANGAGKSGYTKIIKKISGKPRALDLKPNVFNPNPDGKCKINYSIDNSVQQIDWKINANPINDLKSIDVFDTSTGNIYINEANSVTYTPGVIRIFSEISYYFSLIQEKLEQQKSSHIRVIPSIPFEFQNTETAKLFNNLNKENTPEDLSTILIWNETKEQIKKDLENRLKDSDPKRTAEDFKKRKNEVDKIIKEISEALYLINEDSLKELNIFKVEAISKRKISDESSLVIANKSDLQGVGSEVWKALWESARKYSNEVAYVNSSFPNIGDDSKCVLCHQTLNEEAKQRLTSFESFIKSKIENEAVSAENLYLEKISNLPIGQTKETLLTKCNAANLNEKWLNCLINIWEQIQKITNSIKQNLDYTIDYKFILNNLNILKSISDTYDKSSKQYELDAQQFDRIKAASDLLELRAQKWCSEQKDQILKEVERLRKIFIYDSWISQCNTRYVTSKASEISELVITEEYVKRFNLELGLLKANKIKVELVKERASKGIITHSLKLKGITGNKLSEILSEGEHRIIALASFLADVTGGNNNNPFVFDDPISSLDQKYEEKVVERLIELSKTRQVIVFTHRLSLLGQLNDKCDSNLIQILGIRSENWGSGEIGETPLFAKKTLPALNNIKNERLAKAKKIFNNEGNEAYYPFGKSICSDIRILIERIVELDFLADVIQRYRRNVNTMGKVQNLAKIKVEDCDLINDYMTKYSYFEHSQPDEAPVEIPEPNEIEIDIDNLINWLTDFNARK